ncbi:MAG: class I SAM-dependent methyltransferase [Nanoarchaeota archaeon]
MTWTEPFTIKSLSEKDRDLDTRLDEVAIFSSHRLDAQEGFFMLRLAAAPAQRKGVKKILEEHIPGSCPRIAEFGAGAFGVFYRVLLPEQYKRSYTQFDISKTFATYNCTMSGGHQKEAIAVGSAYAMPLPDASCDAIIGLSAWDSMAYPEDSFLELRRVLKPGGAFIHFQDIIPADYPLYRAQILARRERDMQEAFTCAYKWDEYRNGDGRVYREKFLVALQAIENGDELMPASAYLTYHLAALAEGAGFDVRVKGDVSTRAFVPRADYLQQLGDNSSLFLPHYNAFINTPETGSRLFRAMSVPEDMIKVVSVMRVLVAIKR